MQPSALTRPLVSLLCAAALAACATAGNQTLDGGSTPHRVGKVQLRTPTPSPAPAVHRFAEPTPTPAPLAEPSEPALTADDAAIYLKLAQRRSENLSHFLDYVAGETYPRNHIADGYLNVWIDGNGRTCAAATIIRASGAAALVADVAANDNYVVLADITSGPLLDWMLTSGFTQAEIAAIQEPFMREPMQPDLPVAPLTAEDERLRARYAEVTQMLVDGTEANLMLAFERLKQHPELVAALLASGEPVANEPAALATSNRSFATAP